MRADRQPFAFPPGIFLAGAVAVAAVILCLTFALGGGVLAVTANSLLVGLMARHILGEPERVRSKVRSRTSALQDIAYRDSLTGLPNRRFFIWYLEQNLAMRMQNRRRGSRVNRVVLFDLNGFKAVNDTYGHEAGDELLKFIAVTLTAYLPSDALLARLGGDEFVVLVRDSHGGRKTREVEATIRKAAETVFVFDGQDISVSASVGVSSPATARSTAEQLLRESDQRMYADKIAGKERRGEAVPAEVETVIPAAQNPSLNERRRIRARLMLSAGSR
ncbi:GGDEF domain-containing protein [Granulosicoccus sp. 3-233]|uniref:GGDEF domain-containing protein n=1 Tax=Granulosicoccus sp. 3-233 TaxID=3417969 RepID=UPI003D3542B7